MQSTFLIEGQNKDRQTAYGTAFIIGRPLRDDSTKSAFVLVTAKHVLEPIVGETAVLHFRFQDSVGNWRKAPVRVNIRAQGAPLWKAHPTADVVAMYVPLPPEATKMILVPMSFLADDKRLSEIELHPGDEVTALGYPFLAQSPEGFPVLRSGKIASYSLLPTKSVKSFWMDFPVFPRKQRRSSVFCERNRFFGGNIHLGVIQSILGLVTQEKYITETVTERSAWN